MKVDGEYLQSTVGTIVYDKSMKKISFMASKSIYQRRIMGMKILFNEAKFILKKEKYTTYL